eukprot:COSAG06_NODE_1684_length_8722_cov_3.925896_13_plen_62_part_00
MIVFRLLRINAGKKTDGEKSEKVVSIRRTHDGPAEQLARATAATAPAWLGWGRPLAVSCSC